MVFGAFSIIFNVLYSCIYPCNIIVVTIGNCVTRKNINLWLLRNKMDVLFCGLDIFFLHKKILYARFSDSFLYIKNLYVNWKTYTYM